MGFFEWCGRRAGMVTREEYRDAQAMGEDLGTDRGIHMALGKGAPAVLIRMSTERAVPSAEIAQAAHLERDRVLDIFGAFEALGISELAIRPGNGSGHVLTQHGADLKDTVMGA